MFYVYLITNHVNGSIYIGKCGDIDARWYEHKKEACSNRRNQYIYNSMRKYGIDNFSIEELEQHETEQSALDGEVFHIMYRRSIGDKVMNLTNGGEGISGWKHSEEAKEKIAESRRGKPAPNKGKPHTEDTKIKMAAAHENRETYYSLPVIAIDINGNEFEFLSGKEAATALSLNQGNVCATLKGRQHTCGGYRFIYKPKD